MPLHRLSSNPAAWPEGYDRRVLPEVDSTNAEAARIAPGLTCPTWILGLRQTAGRGRRGRAWADPPGNFAATLVVNLNIPPAQIALRSFVAALALADALVQATGRSDSLTLKWPNDVLLGGGKVAGILLETGGQGPQQGPLAIGIGVNLTHAPAPDSVEPGAARPVSVLSQTGVTIAPETFLNHLAPAFAQWEARLIADGFAPIRRAFLGRAARLNETITARTTRDSLTGTFRDIDDTGALVLQSARGLQTVQAADIFF